MKKGFTLVEITVSVLIIAILSVVSAMMLKQWLQSSKDQQRMLDIKSIQYGLKNYYNSNGNYPLPSDNVVKLTASGFLSVAGYQGNIGDLNKRDLNLRGDFVDPTTKALYTYFVSSDQQKYQLIAFMEGEKYSTFSNNAYAVLSYAKYKPKTFGSSLGILLQKNTLLPLNIIFTGNFDLAATNNSYDAYLDSDEVIVGSGNSLLNLAQFSKNGYEQPKTCPAGFIPVPGNKEFQQAGFCAAKYEMKQSTGDAGSWNGANGVEYPVGSAIGAYCKYGVACISTTAIDPDIKGIISKPEGYPIVWINQYNAIQACKSMGSGYHLITNNERMDIARDIELNSQNWGTGKFLNTTVDYYGINRGESNQGRQNSSIGALPANAQQGLTSNLTDTDFRSKRTHVLSNGEIIWDMAGNVREHVNFANTLDGSLYDTINGEFCSGGTATYSFYAGGVDGYPECQPINGNVISTIGAKNPFLNRSNGVGYVHSYASSSKIALRSNSRNAGSLSGIYTIYLGWANNNVGGHVGFRCAY